ncbi:hypothetical protein KCU78_g11239, partial [Aureobasidium melanogenum]
MSHTSSTPVGQQLMVFRSLPTMATSGLASPLQQHVPPTTQPAHPKTQPSSRVPLTAKPGGWAWWMGILEEGGQRIFLPTYAQPGYSAADSNNFTPSRVSYSYILNTETTNDGHLLLKYYHSDWWACPTGEEGVWEVTATLDPAGCLPFAWELRETTAAAPQYYICEGCESRL